MIFTIRCYIIINVLETIAYKRYTIRIFVLKKSNYRYLNSYRYNNKKAIQEYPKYAAKYNGGILMGKTLYLVLENGKVFEGKSFGFEAEVTGEIVFSTGMGGYIETLTDPSYYGQIVVQTYPLIGNYGIIPEDFESEHLQLTGYIVRDWCHNPSNFRCKGDIDTFLKENKIVGMYDIDTRQLTKIIREYGVMNGRIVSNIDNLQNEIDAAKSFSVKNPVKAVSSKTVMKYNCEDGKRRVVLWDFGAKENIRRELINHGCEVIVVPCDTKSEYIKSLNPDGIMLSNGPGNPEKNPDIIEEIKKLSAYKIPTFGICLGHQLLALSQGANTVKLKYGHRSINHPVKDISTGRVYITSQNHGYAVDIDSIPETATASFRSLNDNTCEGVSYKNIPAFSVQFHPESAAGPEDTEFLFDKFMALIDSHKQ